ncbi:M3 family metallopeptidase [Calycomorphotria hydatis]|uniref:oligopeptidase A n=1 Tax=Calycomorphotria hydatis TaxID=2528027 RepID=A0A517TCB4_9PLAN|nr:M3 family metallopeptidase [Calycomorphotria hydatis]QDT66006.1 Oligopeptidase A [Calycomorphotria hydatis]
MDDKLVINPLLAEQGLPDFTAIEAAHVEPAINYLLEQVNAKFEAIEQQAAPSWDATVGALDELDRPFERGWQPVGHLLGVRNSDELRAAHEAVLPGMVAYSLRVQQSQPIYQALKELSESEAWDQLDATQQRIVSQRIKYAELAGVGLEGKAKEQFNKNAEELSQLSTKFSNNVLDATKGFSITITDPALTEGMPDSLKQLAAQSYASKHPEKAADVTAESGPWRFTLDYPMYGPFMEHCRNRELREQMYRAFVTRASSGDHDNTPLIDRILSLRLEQAKLLGYNTFAETSFATKMARSAEEVTDLLDRLREASWDHAVEEMDDLKNLAESQGSEGDLLHWDIAFWAERLREQRFEFTDEQLRPYFSLERVLDGLFSLCEKLFQIDVRPADGEAPVWNKDVRFFTIHDKSGKQLASFYLDPYSRPEDKRGGAWMADCLQRRRLNDDEIQLPVAHLVCNQTPPVGDRPSLMSFREVETLFHEFGHGLQHMLTEVDYADASGINGIEWDAVELPSQFMENWCYHKPTLIGMTKHYKTGEPLPDELFEKINRARTFRAGSMMLRQLEFGLTDLKLHSEYTPGEDRTPFEVQREVNEKTSLLPMLPEARSLCAFSHIFAGGYAAGYYSYKWAEVLSADAFEAFAEVGLDDEPRVQELGLRFRKTILAEGGSRPPMDVFKEFRGREPSPEPLLRHSGLIA